MSVTCGMSVVFPGTPVSSTSKTEGHDITEILLKLELNTITLILTLYWLVLRCHIHSTKWQRWLILLIDVLTITINMVLGYLQMWPLIWAVLCYICVYLKVCKTMIKWKDSADIVEIMYFFLNIGFSCLYCTS